MHPGPSQGLGFRVWGVGFRVNGFSVLGSFPVAVAGPRWGFTGVDDGVFEGFDMTSRFL